MFTTTLHDNALTVICRMLSTALLVTASALPASATVIPYDQVVNSMNPIAYWRHEGNVLDETSNNHDGTIIGTSNFVAGPSLPGITGNMAGNYNTAVSGVINDVSVPDDSAFSFGDTVNDSPFSLSVWINPDSTFTGSFNGVIGKDIAGSDREWALLLLSDRTMRLFIKENGGGLQQSIDTTFAAPIDTWTHVAVTYDGSGGSDAADGIQFWVNGSSAALTNATTDNTYIAMKDTTATVSLGSYFGTGNRFEGLIDEAAVFNGVLSESQILALSGQPQVIPEPSSFLLLGMGALGLVRRRRRRTGAGRRHDS